MLTTRGAKRDTASRFKADRRLEILDDGKPVGHLSCDLGATAGTLTINGTSYTVAPITADADDSLSRLLAQNARNAKPAGKPLALKDASDRAIGFARQVKAGFLVTNGQETFELRKRSAFSPSYHLYRTESEQSLGWVGQKSFFNRGLQIDLPAEFDPVFQVFLLLLSLNLAMQKAANLNAYN